MNFKQQRSKHKEDAHRPSYHLSPPTAWLNDPNGIVQWQGKYHMFYQHNPVEAKWGPPYWGHAVSDDLINWQDLPMALSPLAEPADDGGCWSGCFVNNEGTATLFYTGVKGKAQTTCVATGSADLLTWTKHPNNPVVTAPHEVIGDHNDYRDPYVWQENGKWLKIIGTSINQKGQALVYESTDLYNWTYLNPLVAEEAYDLCEDSGHIWECVNLFALQDKYILILGRWVNHNLTGPVAFIGEFDGRQFVPEKRLALDFGEPCYYALLSMKDEQNRRLVWGWLQEQRPQEEQLKAGWSGVMSLPRVLTLDASANLSIEFPEELISLRETQLKATSEGVFSCVKHGQAFELNCDFGEEQSTIKFEYEADTLSIELNSQTGKAKCSFNDTVKGEFSFDTQTKNQLRLYLDHSVLELVINKTKNFTSRQYPTGKLEFIKLNNAEASIWALKTTEPNL